MCLRYVVIDEVEHRGDRRALAGTRDAGQQHHALIVVAELLDRRRQVEALKSGTKLLTRRATRPTWPSCCSRFTRNRQIDAVDVERVGEVGAAVLLEDLAVPLVHQREA